MTHKPAYDLVIRNGIVVNADGEGVADIGVSGGRIAAITESGRGLLDGLDVIDATDHYVVPGGIDTHTHASWPYAPGRTTDDGFDGAGRAAALGGTTTMVDFVPPQRGRRSVYTAAQERIQQIEDTAPISVALHPILTDASADTLESIPKLIADGMSSFKMYTTYEDDRVNDGEIRDLVQVIARHGGLPGFHAENHDVLCHIGEDLGARGRVGMQDFEASRPAIAEALAIQTVARIGREFNVPVYIFHVSGKCALEAIQQARSEGYPVFGETCTHYLMFDQSVFDSAESWRYTITPPIRTVEDRTYLWSGITDGSLVSVGSDHCAYPADEKRARSGDYRTALLGAAGLQNRTPVLWSEAQRRGLSAQQFVQISAERAARTLGMYPAKGTIATGSDADLAIIDPAASWVGADFAPASPRTFGLYDAIEGKGRARHVISGGRRVVEEFEYCGRSGSGGFLRRRAGEWSIN